ncbi:hypothetical protein [Segetibacter koreensis]|uniref:hypothetical protein n=1 Tax=Segetibacter koreensis TaxID=398037 RepID=UPI0012F7FC5F|nr:hypothetical protein [Segetibacter koreensis]
MKKLLTVVVVQILLINLVTGQEKLTTDTAFKPSGKLWGYTFGDFYYKAHTDNLNRGGANQYTGVEKGRNAFQLRRAYLGYNYDIHPRFSAELLLAAEDNIANQNGNINGDLTSNGKLTFYIKYANIRYKNIWKGTDLVVGQLATPAFSFISEPIWGYRSIERTIADIRRTPSFDLGASLQGKFDPEKGNYGYNLMVGNGTSARPENDKFKWFYGDVYAKFLDKKLVFDLYADYQRLNWTSTFHHSRNMVKGFAGYTTPSFTFGVEAFVNHGQQDVVGNKESSKDTISANATGISLFARGSIIKEKLGYFARFDSYNPDTKYNDFNYVTYSGLTSTYEPNNREKFITAGLDFTPIKNVHFMPNIWYNRYKGAQSSLTGPAAHDHDLVYRITFYYVYGR